MGRSCGPSRPADASGFHWIRARPQQGLVGFLCTPTSIAPPWGGLEPTPAVTLESALVVEWNRIEIIALRLFPYYLTVAPMQYSVPIQPWSDLSNGRTGANGNSDNPPRSARRRRSRRIPRCWPGLDGDLEHLLDDLIANPLPPSGHLGGVNPQLVKAVQNSSFLAPGGSGPPSSRRPARASVHLKTGRILPVRGYPWHVCATYGGKGLNSFI